MRIDINLILEEIKQGVKTRKDRNEIKVDGIAYRWEELNILLDYITNLQQENERLKEWKEDLLKENIELENIRKEAIEYIKENACYDTRCLDDLNYDECDILLNILQGT